MYIYIHTHSFLTLYILDYFPTSDTWKTANASFFNNASHCLLCKEITTDGERNILFAPPPLCDSPLYWHVPICAFSQSTWEPRVMEPLQMLSVFF